VAQRVPLVLADLGQFEHRALDQCQQDGVVDLLLRPEVVGVHLGQCRRRVAQHRHVLGDGRRRVVRQPVVEPVVAGERRHRGVGFQDGVDNVLDQGYELLRHAREPTRRVRDRPPDDEHLAA
jgi:hypothetical protein